MDAIISNDDPTVGQAMDALTAWEQESATSSTTPASPVAPEASANEPTAPATSEGVESAPETRTPEGTPATKEQQTTDNKDQSQTQPKPGETKYEKNKQRIAKTWEEINREKELVRTTAETLKQREAALAEKEQRLAQREAKLSAPKFKPEDYEGHAAKLEAEAKALEDAGDFTKADRKRYDAEKAREYAQQLRANPPVADPTEAEQAQRFQARQKEWWGKAAVDFPNVIKDGTPERNALIQLLNAEPDIVNDPKGMYYASRLVTAETSAARVPELSKALEAAQARIKELEQLTAVPGDGNVPLANGAPKTFEQMNTAEQLAQLEAEARAMSSY